MKTTACCSTIAILILLDTGLALNIAVGHDAHTRVKHAVVPGPMPTVDHSKIAGNGYAEGSPLYVRTAEIRSTTAAPTTLATTTEKKDEGYLPKHGDHAERVVEPAASASGKVEMVPGSGEAEVKYVPPRETEKTYESRTYQEPATTPLHEINSGYNPGEHWESEMKQHTHQYAATALAYVFTALIFALLFKFFQSSKSLQLVSVPGAPPMMPGVSDAFKCGFDQGLFECSGITNSDWKICCLACCCPLITWANTVDWDNNPAVLPSWKLMNFWTAFLLVLLLAAFGIITAGITYIVIAILIFCNRRKIREAQKKEGVQDALSTKYCLLDAFCVFCCFESVGCCLLVQEAREVKILQPDRPLQTGMVGTGRT